MFFCCRKPLYWARSQSSTPFMQPAMFLVIIGCHSIKQTHGEAHKKRPKPAQAQFRNMTKSRWRRRPASGWPTSKQDRVSWEGPKECFDPWSVCNVCVGVCGWEGWMMIEWMIILGQYLPECRRAGFCLSGVSLQPRPLRWTSPLSAFRPNVLPAHTSLNCLELALTHVWLAAGFGLQPGRLRMARQKTLDDGGGGGGQCWGVVRYT